MNEHMIRIETEKIQLSFKNNKQALGAVAAFGALAVIYWHTVLTLRRRHIKLEIEQRAELKKKYEREVIEAAEQSILGSFSLSETFTKNHNDRKEIN